MRGPIDCPRAVPRWECASSSGCPLPPITESGKCARPARWSEGCAPAGLLLLIWVLASADKRIGGVCVTGGPSAPPTFPPSALVCSSSDVPAFAIRVFRSLLISSSSRLKPPISDLGECARPDRWSEGCAPAGLRLLIWVLASADKRSGGVC